MNELIFNDNRIELITRDGELWARATQIGAALGYRDDKAIQRIYSRHKDEFSESMTRLVRLASPSGMQETRIFSLRGAHLLAMFARTKIAKEFRRWVLDAPRRCAQRECVRRAAISGGIRADRSRPGNCQQVREGP